MKNTGAILLFLLKNEGRVALMNFRNKGYLLEIIDI